MYRASDVAFSKVDIIVGKPSTKHVMVFIQDDCKGNITAPCTRKGNYTVSVPALDLHRTKTYPTLTKAKQAVIDAYLQYVG